MNLKTNIRKIKYRLKHDWLTINNVVTLVALLIAFNWVWSSISTMQRNYELQKRVDDKKRQLTVLQLETATLEYERNYYKTNEYQELAAREKLGLAWPGEHMLITPTSTDTTTNESEIAPSTSTVERKKSNFVQWINFLFGANQNSLQK
ncbi:hypothetical protein FWF48_01565 [Candidatus Saccharibacteria bacterium]|nr:hypothetical protein [Candidatus Saccharibacteria bacterium]